ncbi:ABC transporter [Opitutaceae bacterium TAV5]|nr:ABC transporter [Opitutaceae bacterium TAV5]
MKHAIETFALTRRFGRRKALDALTLRVPAGSVFALLGPNGAGKTTTIKLLLNLLAPHDGSSFVLGCDSRKLGPAEFARIGYVAEGQDLPDRMTLGEFADYCRPFYPAWDRELEAVLLRTFELPPDRQLRHLSRGMRMKAALLVALARRPRLLLLDEPFGGLDPVARDDFIRGLIEASLLGEWTVLLSSHDIEEVERLADHIAIIDRGRLQLAESLEALQARVRRVELRFGSPAAAAEAARRLTGTGNPAWLDVEQAGSRAGFVDTAWRGSDSERACRERLLSPLASATDAPGAADNITITARPMPLREIYLTLARTPAPNLKNPVS